MKITFLSPLVCLLFLHSTEANAFWPFPDQITSAPPPLPATALEEEAAPQTSRVFVTGFVPWERLRQELEAAVPRNDSGSRTDPVGNPVVDDVLTWEINRTPIALGPNGASIRATTQLTGTVRLRGTVRLLRGDIGKLLGKLNPTSIPFSVHADLAAHTTVESTPSLAANWRMAPNLRLNVDVTRAEIPVNHVGTISLRGQVRDDVAAKVAGLQRSLEARIAEDGFVEEAARKLFEDACRATEFSIGNNDRGWLVTRPVAFEAAQPVIDGSGIRIGLGLRATAEIVTGKRPDEPECIFPETLEILPLLPEPAFEIDLPASIGWSELSRVVNSSMSGRSWSDEAAGQSISLEVQAVDLSPFGDKVLAGLKFTGRLGGWLGSRFAGTVFLSARPLLDVAGQKLSFVDVTLVLESESALSATGIFGKLAAPLLEGALTDRVVVDLAGHVADARREADAAVTKLNAELSSRGVKASHRIDSIELRRLTPSADSLGLRLAAKGSLSVDLEALK